ncbi:hypothetical protein HUE87_08250 [Candidatus Sulfurimonas marisnigri]|uniref:Uncharacterized protein n=1 Tax=Candidatus Sulfurimonas marisnigri TaxID=2740405 RepID=A0A7S7LYR5_9BACT|nr:hypothetical protein [Candidatus Sulfurimonas marisnigri]QOY53886.1 hypothetical protein HUE87_08250 [Candidatus Sulfurimonas marisnigri]
MINKKSRVLFYTFLLLVGAVIAEITYLGSKSGSERINSKVAFVKMVGLPDLAISTEASYVRHRSMSDMFSIFKDDGSLREYFVSTFTYSHSRIINKKSLNEK